MQIPNDPRLTDGTLLALAAMRRQQRKAAGLVVVYVEDHENSTQAIQRVLGRQAYAWETVLLVTYEPPLPQEETAPC